MGRTSRLALAGFFFISAVLLAAILWLAGGHFTYSLDDPYIHLALAENLPMYHGLNAPPDVSAPSSSVLYPWLLMPLAHTGAAFMAPLLLNLTGGVVAILLLVRVERQIDLVPSAGAAVRAVLVLGFALIINLFTLLFTGMEHTLHVAAALAVFSGLLDAVEKKPLPWWFWVAIIIGPMFRYEAFALSVLALLCVACWGEWKKALPAFLLMLVGPLAYSFYLHGMGLPWLPGSVLAKSVGLGQVNDGRGVLAGVLNVLLNFLRNFKQVMAWGHTVLLLLLFVLLWRVEGRKRVVALVVVAAGMAHLFLSSFAWLDRYHAYLLALDLLALLYVARPMLQRVAERSSNGHFTLVLLLLGAGASSLFCTVSTPASSRQIYNVHAQLHRFLTESWKEPVASYDIGYPSWQNPWPVIDLFGLADEAIRQINVSGLRNLLLPPYLKARHVGLVLMNFEVDPSQNGGWKKIAELKTDGRFIVAYPVQRFYLTDPAREKELREKLAAFRPTLPAGVSLDILPESP